MACRSGYQWIHGNNARNQVLSAPRPQTLVSDEKALMQKGRLQKVVQGLIYPAVLGSILVWFGQALALYGLPSSAHAAQGTPPPSYLVLLFASILVFYAPAAYLLMEESKSTYGALLFVVDVVEMVSMFFVFFELGLITPRTVHFSSAYSYLLLLTFVGLVQHILRWNFENFVLSLIFCLLAAIGTLANLRFDHINELNGVLLGFLLACLVIYYATLWWRFRRNSH